MAYHVVNLPALVPTSSGATRTSPVDKLDDATSIIIYAGNGATTQLLVEVAQFNANGPTSSIQSNESTRWFPLMANGTSSAFAFVQDDAALTINAIGFKSLRLVTTGADAAGVIVGTVSKQIQL